MDIFGHFHILTVLNGIMYTSEQITAHFKLSGYIHPQSRAKGRNVSLIACYAQLALFIYTVWGLDHKMMLLTLN